MGAQFSSSLEYPVKPSLSFLEDSTLFFSVLPKDISKYVLTPYLLSGTSRQPVSQSWTAPQLISCFTARITSFTFLQDGDVLYYDDNTARWLRVSPANRHEPIVLYDMNTVLPSGQILEEFCMSMKI